MSMFKCPVCGLYWETHHAYTDNIIKYNIVNEYHGPHIEETLSKIVMCDICRKEIKERSNAKPKSD